jgi:hypothetical protein
MSLFRSFVAWLLGDQPESSSPPAPSLPTRQRELPPPHFLDVTWVDRSPSNAEVKERILYCVLSQNIARWALFRCPCNCGHVITLSLQTAHNPRWRISKGRQGHPTLYPSIWRNAGCLSHFWVDDGRIVWCEDTGQHPNSRSYR